MPAICVLRGIAPNLRDDAAQTPVGANLVFALRLCNCPWDIMGRHKVCPYGLRPASLGVTVPIVGDDAHIVPRPNGGMQKP